MSWITAALGMDKNNAGDPFRRQQEDYLGQVMQYKPLYDNIAQGQRDLYNGQLPEYERALQNEEDLLGRSTSEQQRTAYINRATQNVANNYARGINNATSSLAARGLGNSGSMAGALTNAEMARAGAISNAANAADQYFDNQQLQRENMLTNLAHGATQGALGNEENAMHGGIGLGEWGAGQYGNLANQAYALQAQRQAAAGQALGGLISAGATAYGMGRGVTPYGNQNNIHPYYSDGSDYDSMNPTAVDSGSGTVGLMAGPMPSR